MPVFLALEGQDLFLHPCCPRKKQVLALFSSWMLWSQEKKKTAEVSSLYVVLIFL